MMGMKYCPWSSDLAMCERMVEKKSFALCILCAKLLLLQVKLLAVTIVLHGDEGFEIPPEIPPFSGAPQITASFIWGSTDYCF
jgi:hypothetical protein